MTCEKFQIKWVVWGTLYYSINHWWEYKVSGSYVCGNDENKGTVLRKYVLVFHEVTVTQISVLLLAGDNASVWVTSLIFFYSRLVLVDCQNPVIPEKIKNWFAPVRIIVVQIFAWKFHATGMKTMMKVIMYNCMLHIES